MATKQPIKKHPNRPVTEWFTVFTFRHSHSILSHIHILCGKKETNATVSKSKMEKTLNKPRKNKTMFNKNQHSNTVKPSSKKERQNHYKSPSNRA